MVTGLYVRLGSEPIMMIKNELNVNYVGNCFIKKSVTNSTFEIYCLLSLIPDGFEWTVKIYLGFWLRHKMSFVRKARWTKNWWTTIQGLHANWMSKRWRKKLQLIWLELVMCEAGRSLWALKTNLLFRGGIWLYIVHSVRIVSLYSYQILNYCCLFRSLCSTTLYNRRLLL